jgi:membrane-associated phospholipid phosphatase
MKRAATLGGVIIRFRCLCWPIAPGVLALAFTQNAARADTPLGPNVGHVAAKPAPSATGDGRAASPSPRTAVPTGHTVPTPLTGLGDDIVEIFSGWGLVAFGAASAGTAVMVLSGADHEIHLFAHEQARSTAWGDAAYYSGYTLPVLVPLALYGLAAIENELERWGAAAATTQAVGLALALTGVLKLSTGRPFPGHGEHPDDPNRFQHPEYAREFDPFSGEWAWPSGHAAGTFAIASVLTGYYSDRVWIPLVTYPIATAISLGMIAGEHHWASDVVAGALMAQTIGYTIGRAFRRRVDRSLANPDLARARDAAVQPPVLWFPVLGRSSFGVGFRSAF